MEAEEKKSLLRSVGLPVDLFATMPIKVLQLLKRRAWNEKASEMREPFQETALAPKPFRASRPFPALPNFRYL